MAYSAYLNILWLICCLPIVTIGASTTALFYVTLKMAEDRDDGLTGMFFRAFRQNFLPATKLWLVLLGAGAFLAMDGYIVWHIWSQSIFWTLVAALLIVAAIVYAVVLLYAFPLLARFENTTFGILKTALLVGSALPCLHAADGRHLFFDGLGGGQPLYPPPSCWGLAAAQCSVLSCWSTSSTPLAATRTLRLQPKTLRAKRMEKTNMPRMNERARQDWATLRSLHGKKRLEHIWSYYKLPIIIVLILFYMAGYAVYRQATKKEDVLYLALVNIAPGDTLTEQLTAGFARDQGLTGKQQVYLYSGLLLSESEGADEEYVYASEMRIVSAITAQRLDVVLMDAEARDAFAAQGYLADLSSLIPGLACQWLDVSQTPLIRQAGFPEAVYLGVLANAPHPERAAAYIDYLLT